MTEEFKIIQHVLVPKHVKLSSEETKKVLDKYNIGTSQLPKISIKDPAISELSVKVGEVIKIERESPTAKQSEFFRVVVNE